MPLVQLPVQDSFCRVSVIYFLHCNEVIPDQDICSCVHLQQLVIVSAGHSGFRAAGHAAAP